MTEQTPRPSKPADMPAALGGVFLVVGMMLAVAMFSQWMHDKEQREEGAGQVRASRAEPRRRKSVSEQWVSFVGTGQPVDFAP